MTLKRIAATLSATGALTACLVVATAPLAHADTCYEAGFERSPSAAVVLAPPAVAVDDGDPYAHVSPGACVAS
jgi:hypothetical protein